MKQGHPVLAVVLGILGILLAFFLPLLGGYIGGIIAGLLGLAALLIGISGVKAGGKGVAGIVVGVLAVILAVVLTFGSIGVLKEVKVRAAKYAEEAPLVVKCLDKPELGFLGMILNMPQNEGDLQQLLDQFNLIREKNPDAFQTSSDV